MTLIKEFIFVSIIIYIAIILSKIHNQKIPQLRGSC
jgi:hypothetical protein